MSELLMCKKCGELKDTSRFKPVVLNRQKCKDCTNAYFRQHTAKRRKDGRIKKRRPSEMEVTESGRTRKKYPSQDYLYQIFAYSDGALYRRDNGERAGTLLNTGYRSVYVDGIPYVEHVLIFILHHGTHPEAVDHINMNKTDNRIENLRGCTFSQNSVNQKKYRTKKSSKYKGVTWHIGINKYTVVLVHQGVRYNLGAFDSEEEAACAYNEAAKKYFGEFAYLNEV